MTTKFTDEQIKQWQIRLMLATLLARKIVTHVESKGGIYDEIRHDALSFIEMSKSTSFESKEVKIVEKNKKPKFRARRIDTKNTNKWAGQINKRDVCRATSEKGAIKRAKAIYNNKTWPYVTGD